MASDNEVAEDSPIFDPVKLEQLDVTKDYPMEPDDFQMLYHNNCYCEMAHCNKNGFPIVTPMFYVVIDDEVYMSSIKKYRAKVHHLEDDPRISVSIHNDGAQLRHQKAILIIGRAEVSYEEELKTKVHWAIIDKYWRELTDPEVRENAFKAVHTPLRAIIRVIPKKVISWDFGKMVETYTPGVWFGDAYDIVKDL